VLNEIYRLVIDKCYRMNLLKDQIAVQSLYKANQSISEIINDLDNNLSQALLPRIERILDKGLFDMYQVLYTIDVEEEAIKAQIMELENTTMIPSIIAFAIIDRLKRRYQNYPLLQQAS